MFDSIKLPSPCGTPLTPEETKVLSDAGLLQFGHLVIGKEWDERREFMRSLLVCQSGFPLAVLERPVQTVRFPLYEQEIKAIEPMSSPVSLVFFAPVGTTDDN